MSYRSQRSIPIYRSADIRGIEAHALTTLHISDLMERAGLAAAQVACDLVGDKGRGILVLAGPGNNGGDAFVVARWLKAWWFKVSVVFAGDLARLPSDAQAAYEAWHQSGGNTLTRMAESQDWDLVVDGLFGIGLKRDLGAPYLELIAAANARDVPILALDVPSGLDADTGQIRGSAVRASVTATFIGLKPGLLTAAGPDHSGRIVLCELDLDPVVLPSSPGMLLGADIVTTALPRRRADSHKGDFGNVGVIGGAQGMVGAAILAGRAAIKLGAGRVYLGLLAGNHPSCDRSQPELMLRAVREVLQMENLNCLAVGPGLGVAPEAHQILKVALSSALPLVLDADALNLVAVDRALQQLLAQRDAATVLTPHPAEAARLSGSDTKWIQSDRVAAATALAARYRAHVVLKGNGSICALPDGTWFINTTGNPGMASAGMGDVLTGIVAALWAQGATPKNAMLCATHLHGAAADSLAAQGIGPIGMTASEVIDAARSALNRAHGV